MTEPAAISRRHLDAALAPLGVALVALDVAGTITYASPQIPSVLGLPPSEVEGRSLLDFLHDDDVAMVVSSLARWDGRAGSVTGPRTRLRTASGEWIDLVVDVATGPLVAPLGAVVAAVRPRDARAELEQDLRQYLVHQDRQARLAALFVEGNSDTFDATIARALAELGSLEYVTRIALYRGDDREVELSLVWEAPANAPTLPLPDRRAIAGHALLEALARLDEVDIDRVAALGDDQATERDELLAAGVQSYLAVPMATAGRFSGFVSAEVTIEEVDLSRSHHSAFRTAAAVIGDAFARHEAQEALTFRAVHDPVTGLGNHGRFLEALAAGGHPSGSPTSGATVVLVDLEGFKLVNDALGHGVGDELLRHVAGRLEATAPPGTLLARLGGDDFACLVADLADTDAVALASELVGAVEGAVRVGEHELRVRARAGVAHTSDLEGGGGPGATALLGAAEAALARSAEPGAASVVRFDAELGAEIDRRHWVEAELPLALDAGHLALHYQPEVDLGTGRIVGVEALLRWLHPDRGLLTAGSFVAHAEHMAAFTAVTDWVLAVACAQQVQWARSEVGPGDVVVRVNLSSRDVSRPGLGARLERAIAAAGLAPDRLCVEVTETAVLSDPDQANQTCREIRSLGVGLAIDDFGTGHWSMRSLTALPVDILKIDRSLVDRLDRSAAATGVAAAVLGLADSLGLVVVAEGIETEAELEVLRGLGCQRGQGFLLGRPAPAGTIGHRITVPGRRG